MAGSSELGGGAGSAPRLELPVVGGRAPATERADAARNRARILEAAARLFAERSPEQVGMDDVAREACVGKGTLYRRFGDQAGLALALLDERERSLQRAAMQGPPPLGPEAPPVQRLAAYLVALLAHVDANLDLLRIAERRGDRFDSPPYRFHRLHVALLVEEAAPSADAEALADLLLAPLAAEVVRYQRVTLGWPLERIAAALERMARGVTADRCDS
jgi:AcrR family transcriptional regulator